MECIFFYPFRQLYASKKFKTAQNFTLWVDVFYVGYEKETKENVVLHWLSVQQIGLRASLVLYQGVP